MTFAKKNKSGREERRQLLEKSGFPESFLNSKIGTSAQCTWDDQFDACAAAWTAERILKGKYRRFPKQEDLNDLGLDMAIWA